MLPKIKFKYKSAKGMDKKGILYYFKDRAQFERCIASGCKLLSPDNVFKATDFGISLDLISSIAIEMWRLEKRIDRAKDESSNSENIGSTAISDQLQRIKDIFKKQDIEIHEHTGESYNDGLSMRALHFEEMDNLAKGTMKIIETVKPSIYYKGKVIFNGEVIVGKSKER